MSAGPRALEPESACGRDDHCVTCGDIATPMRVERLEDADGLAWCREPEGTAAALVDAGLVGPAKVGDLLLVHAGTALVRLEHPGAGRA